MTKIECNAEELEKKLKHVKADGALFHIGSIMRYDTLDNIKEYVRGREGERVILIYNSDEDIGEYMRKIADNHTIVARG